MPGRREKQLSQRTRGGRDVNASARDQVVVTGGDHTVVNIAVADTAGSKAHGTVLVDDLPQQPPGFQLRAELLATLDAGVFPLLWTPN